MIAVPAFPVAALGDLALYAKAAHLQQQGQYDAAVQRARGLKDPALKEAGEVLVGQCLIAQGAYEKAEQHYAGAIIRPGALGLYRGELLLGRAMAVCLQRVDVERLREAGEWLSQADAWCRQMSDEQALASLREHVEQRCMPAALASWPFHTSPHSAVRSIPGVIPHVLNTDWYAAHLTRQVLVLRLYIRSQLEQSPDVSIKEAQSIGAAVLLIQGTLDRAYIIDRPAWESLQGPDAPRLRFGLFLIAAGRHDMAAGIFDPVYALSQNKDQPTDSATLSVASLGSGLCGLRLGNHKRGEQILGRFNALLRNTPAAPAARLALANHLVGASDKQSRDAAYRLYTDIARDYEGSHYAIRALLAMAVAAANNNDGTILSEAQRLLVSANAPNAANSTAQALTQIASHEPATDQTPPKPRRRPGSPEPANLVVIKDAHAFSGNLAMQHQWQGWPDAEATGITPHATSVNDPEVLNALGLTLMRCHHTCHSRLNGYSVSGLRVALSEFEPRPPASVDGRSSFYRAPFLWCPLKGIAR